MSALVMYVLDTETTGLQPKYAEICEYSIIRCSDKVQLSRQIRVDKPENASYDALKVTGKTFADLKQGISKQQAIEDFHQFINRDGLTSAHRCLVGHNISFDRRFLHALWDQYNQTFPFDLYIDTIPLAKKLANQTGKPTNKMKLEFALDLFGLKKVGGSHTAKGDSRNTFLLWQHLLDSNIDYLDVIKQIPHHPIEEDENEEVN